MKEVVLNQIENMAKRIIDFVFLSSRRRRDLKTIHIMKSSNPPAGFGMTFFKRHLISIFFLSFSVAGFGQIKGIPKAIVPLDANSYHEAKPWVVWYFMHASYSKEGIKADLEAMAANNIAGAYFTPIKGKTDPPLFDPPRETLTPEWWEIFRYMVEEARKLGIQIALFPNDGFATAGGPWITPEKSMQKIVSADTILTVEKSGKLVAHLPVPEINENYYQDLQLLAIPIEKPYRRSDAEQVTVSNSYGEDLARIAKRDNKVHFATSEEGWIQFEFERPFTCNSLKIDWTASNYQVNRMKIYASDDGQDFREVTQLQSPRMGWLDWDNGVTHTIPVTTAKYFRFVYDPEGSEPGAEDLDVAKWKPSLKFTGITLFEEAKINQFEGKTGEIWRVSAYTDESFIEEKAVIRSEKVLSLDPTRITDNRIEMELPAGHWKILRIGHTSTGHKNETAGAGKGLEADKLDKDAMALQFEKWYGEARKSVAPDVSDDVLTVYHIDSWECGSQNWTKTMTEEFRARRNYAIGAYWPVLAGYIVNSIEESEAFLYDYRLTLSELLHDNGFGTLKEKCDEYGVKFTAEATAPVMTGDGLSHFFWTDRTMGEFWYRTPSHDKPMDILEAISAGHVYGKNVVMSEAFTQIRMQWDEHPRLLKSTQDRNYALGVNNLVYHVYVHNPWLDRQPGMTMDGIGLYFQRDQTWWDAGKAWVDYAIRAQQLLQYGKPVRDIAVFVGEEIPRRAILPDRLVDVLPGIIGPTRVDQTKERLRNDSIPMQKIATVTTTANMYDPAGWVDPLRGYAYDSFNPDVLLNHSQVRDGKVVFSDHVGYQVLVVPANHTLNHHGTRYTLPTLKQFVELIEKGATVLFEKLPTRHRGNLSSADSAEFYQLLDKFKVGLVEKQIGESRLLSKKIGKGTLLVGAYHADSFSAIGVEEDVIINQKENPHISWIHRASDRGDVYFVANQDSVAQQASFSFRIGQGQVYLYDPVDDRLNKQDAKLVNGRYVFDIAFDAFQSYFVVFSQEAIAIPSWATDRREVLKGKWGLTLHGIPHQDIVLDKPAYWTEQTDHDVKYHSGEGSYTMTFRSKRPSKNQRVVLQLTDMESMATVYLNDQEVGVIWTKPYEIDVTDYLKKGRNKLEIKVVNTWGNRFWYESNHPDVDKKMQTTAPSRFLKGFLPAGLNGEVRLVWYKEQ